MRNYLYIIFVLLTVVCGVYHYTGLDDENSGCEIPVVYKEDLSPPKPLLSISVMAEVKTKIANRIFDRNKNGYKSAYKVSGPSLCIVITELGLDNSSWNFIKSNFPKSVTAAFFASSVLSKQQNLEARKLGMETLMMIPMETMKYPEADPGSNTLLTNVSLSSNKARLVKHLATMDGYLGVMPYMGNRLLKVGKDLFPILDFVHQQGLLYFEPRLSRSIAKDFYTEKGMKDETLYVKANIDIPRECSAQHIKTKLKLVENKLKNNEKVVLVLSSDIVNLRKISPWLHKMIKQKVMLLPISAMV